MTPSTRSSAGTPSCCRFSAGAAARSGRPNFAPKECVAIFDLAKQGKTAEAFAIFKRLLECLRLPGQGGLRRRTKAAAKRSVSTSGMPAPLRSAIRRQAGRTDQADRRDRPELRLVGLPHRYGFTCPGLHHRTEPGRTRSRRPLPHRLPTLGHLADHAQLSRLRRTRDPRRRLRDPTVTRRRRPSHRPPRPRLRLRLRLR